MSDRRQLERALELVRRARLYPSTILHGGSAAARQAAALELGRALLCSGEADRRPCGACPHCQRIAWPGAETEKFHPDFTVLSRDLKTTTSAEATREWLRGAQVAPFEARGQVFVVAEADTLSAEAGDALLKAIEEPGLGSPRHFFLLAPSRLDLPPTLRSRSMALYLGAAEPPEETKLEGATAEFAAALDRFLSGGGGVFLLEAAAVFVRAGSFSDARSEGGFELAAHAVRAAATDPARPAPVRRRLLALAQAILEAPPLRLRGISAERILEGLLSEHLAPLAPPAPPSATTSVARR